MKISDIWNNRNFRIPVIFFIVVLFVLFVKFSILKTGLTFPVFSFLEASYLDAVESFTNVILTYTQAGVVIGSNHQIIFSETSEYINNNQDILNNWTEFLLFKKWSAFILFFVWFFSGSLRKKIVYTLFFIAAHYISVVSGLLLLTIVGPLVVEPGSLSQLKPNIIGALLMLTLFVVWFNDNRFTLFKKLKKIKLNLNPSNKLLKEIIVIVYLYSILRYFIVPYFNFYYYINFLLTATNSLVGIFNYQGTIDGPYLVGKYGTLFMAKWCLGFVTMFIFSAMIFLTGKEPKSIIKFTLVGIVLLHIVNIIRLAVLFIMVQYISDTEKIDNHHLIYNLVVYAFIFALWVLWFEKFSKGLGVKNQLQG